MPAISVYQLKSQFQEILKPIVNLLYKINISPNQVTIFACTLSVVYGLMIAYQPTSTILLLGLPLFMFLRMALNAIDGVLAKSYNLQSNFGAILNEMGDVISDSALFLSFAFIPGFPIELIVLFTLLAILSEMMGVVGIQIGASRRYDGPMGKSDRAVAVGAMGLLMGLGVSLSAASVYIFTILCFLTTWTIVNRARYSLKEAGHTK